MGPIVLNIARHKPGNLGRVPGFRWPRKRRILLQSGMFLQIVS